MVSQAAIDAVIGLRPYQILPVSARSEFAAMSVADWDALYAQRGAAFVGGAMAMVDFSYARIAPQQGRLAGGLAGLAAANAFNVEKGRFGNSKTAIFQSRRDVYNQYQEAFSKYYPESGGTFQQFLMIAAVAVGGLALSGQLAGSPLLSGAGTGSAAGTAQATGGGFLDTVSGNVSSFLDSIPNIGAGGAGANAGGATGGGGILDAVISTGQSVVEAVGAVQKAAETRQATNAAAAQNAQQLADQQSVTALQQQLDQINAQKAKAAAAAAPSTTSAAAKAGLGIGALALLLLFL